jgi:hypothetical protein
VGGQSVVVVLDVRRNKRGAAEVWTHNGTRSAGKLAADLAKAMADRGAGEIVVNSIDNDGVMKGYDLDLVAAIRDAVGVPVTVLGGAGSLEHVAELIRRFGLVGAAAGSLFVFKGVYRAVLINYPSRADKDALLARAHPAAMKQVLQSLKNGRTEVASVPCPAVKWGQLLVASSRTLISAGTERTLVSFGKASLVSKARQQPERVRAVLDKIKTDGVLPTIEAVLAKLDQPLPMGYCNVGVVTEVAEGVTGYAVGERVVLERQACRDGCGAREPLRESAGQRHRRRRDVPP